MIVILSEAKNLSSLPIEPRLFTGHEEPQQHPENPA
jgi:hypothetical protein